MNLEGLNTFKPSVSKSAQAVLVFLRDIKVEHSVFALPFAVLTAFLVSMGLPPLLDGLLILVAMVSLRTFAMGFNRVADTQLDMLNPRTKGRPLAAKKGSVPIYLTMLVVSLAVFLVAAFLLRPLALWLAPIPIVATVAYPYLKRFTWLCHFGIGVVYLIVPPAVEIALTGGLGWGSVLIGFAPMLWVSGFDVLYTINDLEHDREHGIYSIPAKFGIRNALWITRGLHLLSMALLLGAGLVFGVHWLYYVSLGLITVLTIYENMIVKPNDLSKLNQAFFPINGTIAIVFGVLVSISAVLAGS